MSSIWQLKLSRILSTSRIGPTSRPILAVWISYSFLITADYGAIFCWLQDHISCQIHQKGNQIVLFFLRLLRKDDQVKKATHHIIFKEIYFFWEKISGPETPLIMLTVRNIFQQDGFLFPLTSSPTCLPIFAPKKFLTWFWPQVRARQQSYLADCSIWLPPVCRCWDEKTISGTLLGFGLIDLKG